MGPRLRTALLIALLGLALGLGFLATDDGEEPGRVLAGEDTRPPGGRDADPALAPPQSDSPRKPSDPPPAPAPPPGEAVSSPMAPGVIESDGPPVCQHEHTGRRPRTPKGFFEDAYAGYGRKDLLVAKVLLEEDLATQQNLLVSERLAAGLCETYVFERLEDIEAYRPPLHDDGGLIHASTSVTLDDGRVQSRLTFLPYEEYVGTYEKLDELYYVLGLLSARRETPGSGD